jgi:hypothetical protein
MLTHTILTYFSGQNLNFFQPPISSSDEKRAIMVQLKTPQSVGETLGDEKGSLTDLNNEVPMREPKPSSN